jgi:hypothetical protein
MPPTDAADSSPTIPEGRRALELFVPGRLPASEIVDLVGPPVYRTVIEPPRDTGVRGWARENCGAIILWSCVAASIMAAIIVGTGHSPIGNEYNKLRIFRETAELWTSRLA